jgi:lipopolysaccharide/colanic/teichoic acid biosynthesis glycosyltransferase
MIVCVLSWLMPIVALLIKLESPGPVFFVQNRSGLNNNTFSCLKFRTMCVNSDSDTKQAGKNDARITRVGHFLRLSNLDEFPQFFNVLVGDMSIVGPRPHMVAHTDYYSKLINTYMERHWLKPGITGLAQAKGFRGETKEIQQMENRVEQDRQYVYHRTFGLDLQIIGMTVWNMMTFQKSGA